jgi:hypothetical protein
MARPCALNSMGSCSHVLDAHVFADSRLARGQMSTVCTAHCETPGYHRGHGVTRPETPQSGCVRNLRVLIAYAISVNRMLFPFH